MSPTVEGRADVTQRHGEKDEAMEEPEKDDETKHLKHSHIIKSVLGALNEL